MVEACDGARGARLDGAGSVRAAALAALAALLVFTPLALALHLLAGRMIVYSFLLAALAGPPTGSWVARLYARLAPGGRGLGVQAAVCLSMAWAALAVASGAALVVWGLAGWDLGALAEALRADVQRAANPLLLVYLVASAVPAARRLG